MLMVEWTSEQFSFYNDRIQNLQNEFNASSPGEGQGRVLDDLIGIVDDFIGIGKEDIEELETADDRRIRALARRVGLKTSPEAGGAKNKLMGRYDRNIGTLERMKAAIATRNWGDLREYAGSMRSAAFPGGIPSPDAPFLVLMGFITNMQLVSHGLGVVRKKGWEDAHDDRCPICESELCRCCSDCEQVKCVCEKNAADRIKMISDFVPENPCL